MDNALEESLLPLPKGKWEETSNTNLGLYFNKFFQWSKDDSGLSKADNWVKSFLDKINAIQKNNEYDQRYRKMVMENNGLLIELECLTDLIIGMGNAHPLENGFTFDHAQGLPFIPGTTLKGIWKAALRKRNGSNGETKKVDDLIFLDAIPIGVKMKVDIMTPHYQPYYSKGEAPGDWFKPIPIQFVAVCKGSKFLWGILPRISGSENKMKEAINLVTQWLRDFGIGGKTAVGYGRIKLRVIGRSKR